MNLLFDNFVKYQYVSKNESDEIKFHNYREYEYNYKLREIIEASLNYVIQNTKDDFEFEYNYEIDDNKTNVYYHYTEAY